MPDATGPNAAAGGSPWVRARIAGGDWIRSYGGSQGTDLYVVENGAAQISRLKVNPGTGLASLAETYPVTGAETPTTAALFGNNLYAVDARFGSMTGPYCVYQVPR